MNLVDAVKDQLSGEVLGRIGSMLGESETTTAKATTGAVPALLSALMGSASTAGGAEKMLPVLGQLAGGGGLGNILGALKGGDAGAVQSQGSGMLESLLGGNVISGVAEAVAKYAGISPSVVKMLLPYLTPLIMGTVAKHFGGSTPTPQGLVSFFADQKSNVEKAIPAGLSLPSLPGMPKMDAPKVTVPEAPGLPGWLLPLVGLGLLGLAAWYFLGQTPAPEKPDEVSAEVPGEKKSLPAPAPADEKPAMPTVPAEATTFIDSLKGLYSTATETLGGIKDPATAEAAAPKLKELNGSLDALKPMWDMLPAAAKAAVAPVQSSNLATLKALVEKVLAIPGVADKIKPILDEMVSKLTALA